MEVVSAYGDVQAAVELDVVGVVGINVPDAGELVVLDDDAGAAVGPDAVGRAALEQRIADDYA